MVHQGQVKGLSYPILQRPADPAGRERTCEVCGRPLPFGKRKFCCSTCAAVARSRRQARARKSATTCQACGRPLGPGRKRYCDDRCACAARRERTRSERMAS